MEHLNPELLKQRMMTGALRGSLQEEIPTMARCKGKLENDTRCTIIAAPGKDRCTKCEAIGAELYDKVMKAPEPKPLRAHDLAGKKKPGRPAKKGTISEAEQELQAATESASVNEKLPEWAGGDHSVGGNEMVQDQPADPGKLIEDDDGPNEVFDTFHPDLRDLQIPPVAPDLASEAIDPCAESSLSATETSRGLGALLRAPSAPPIGMFIPFASEELAALDESEVTPEIIREFVIMGLEGKLCMVDDSDPLAKSRHAAA